MLELGERYFSPSEELGDDEAEFKSITYEKPVSNWRAL
jgi:hypothetical protein